ncbi:MAG: hypothetical protein GC190_16500 [Alphaproteobacteria bacterium]|nr:hypothetical protein [Alphaproteobacteria bacterium]
MPLKHIALLAASLMLIAAGNAPAVVDIDGVGTLKIGMTIAQAEKAANAKIAVHNDEDPQSECVNAEFPDFPEHFTFMLIKGTIARFDVYEGQMKTAEGAGIGSSEDDVKRLYANAKIEVSPHAYVDGHYLEVTMPGFANLRYVFETDGRSVTAFRAGRLPEVRYVEGCS